MSENNNVPYEEFGKRLAGLRKEAGMTRQRLSELCGIAPSTIVNYEHGTRIPYADTAVRMAQTFGLSVEELLGMENPETEMEKAKTVDDMGRIFGKRAADSAQEYLDGTQALLAGGALSPEYQQDFIDIMRNVLFEAEIRAKEKFTPKKFRTPIWKEKTEAMRTAVDEQIKCTTDAMNARAASYNETE